MEFEKLRPGGSFGAFYSARGVETERSVTATALSGMLRNLPTRTQLGLSVQCRCCCPLRKLRPCLRSHGLNLAPVIKPSEGNLSAPGLCCVGRSSEIYVTSKVHRELMQHVTTYVCTCLLNLAFIWNSLSLLQLFLPKCSKNVYYINWECCCHL